MSLISLIFVLTFTSCDDDDNIKNPATVTVSQAKTLKDDAQVRIVGTIENTLGVELYLFSDNTGSIAIEVDNKIWAVNLINPTTLTFPLSVEIIGEVDRENAGIKIDVKKITII
jgi:uncharacterized protein (TIGR00156 family)